MIIHIIFFSWIAFVPGSEHKVPEAIDKFYVQECNRLGGELGRYKAGVRRYKFNYEGWVNNSAYHGVDLICFRAEIVKTK